MTEVKAFVSRDSSPPGDRTVAAVLILTGMDREGDRLPGLLDPLGPTCLFDRALQCLTKISEATERALWSDDAALLERFDSTQHAGIRLLAAPLDRSLQPGTPDALLSTHVALIDGRHPFLRPNTIDEAIRLLKIRGDVDAISSCVRVHGELFGLHGQPVLSPSKTASMLLTCDAFTISPARDIAHGLARKSPPLAFEIAFSEGFRVDSVFAQQLAGALLDVRAREA
jgi:hypothetical protein